MPNDGYHALASVYNQLNNDVNYTAWADFTEECFLRYGGGHKPATLLELGCGTGSMTMELARRGYDMTALDLSEDMLAVAYQQALEADLPNILFLCGDMADFELYGTVQGVVCCLDGINHLSRREDVAACFSLVANYLEPGGVFLFDLNTPHKFKTRYADNDYIMEDDGALLCWQNRLNKKGDVCDFILTVFEKQKNGLYKRTDGIQRERCYTLRTIRNLLTAAGLEFADAVSSYTFAPITPTTERWYIAARKPE